jgi:hypothetical protein
MLGGEEGAVNYNRDERKTIIKLASHADCKQNQLSLI